MDLGKALESVKQHFVHAESVAQKALETLTKTEVGTQRAAEAVHEFKAAMNRLEECHTLEYLVRVLLKPTGYPIRVPVKPSEPAQTPPTDTPES